VEGQLGGAFDAVLASNLLCRLPRPAKFLAEVPRLVKQGGVLVLLSPYSWLEEYTPRDEWLGGVDGSDSSAVVAGVLQGQGLELVHKSDLPFVIREHERKFQYGVSECTVWRKA